MTLKDFHFLLPQELIQRTRRPLEEIRLLVVHKNIGTIEHKLLTELPDIIPAGKTISYNNICTPKYSFVGEFGGRPVRVTLLTKLNDTDYDCLVDADMGIQPGRKIDFHGTQGMFISQSSNRIKAIRFQGSLPGDGAYHYPQYMEGNDEFNTGFYQEGPVFSIHPPDSLPVSKLMLKQIEADSKDMNPITHAISPSYFSTPNSDNLDDILPPAEYYKAKFTPETICLDLCSLKAIEGAKHKRELNGYYSLRYFFDAHYFEWCDGMLTTFHPAATHQLITTWAYGGYDLMKFSYDLAIKNSYKFLAFGDLMYISNTSYGK